MRFSALAMKKSFSQLLYFLNLYKSQGKFFFALIGKTEHRLLFYIPFYGENAAKSVFFSHPEIPFPFGPLCAILAGCEFPPMQIVVGCEFRVDSCRRFSRILSRIELILIMRIEKKIIYCEVCRKKKLQYNCDEVFTPAKVSAKYHLFQ